MKCLIVSSCLLVLNVALMNIVLGMSRVALEKPFQKRGFSVKTPKIWMRMDVVNTRASKCRSHHRGGQQEVK